MLVTYILKNDIIYIFRQQVVAAGKGKIRRDPRHNKTVLPKRRHAATDDSSATAEMAAMDLDSKVGVADVKIAAKPYYTSQQQQRRQHEHDQADVKRRKASTDGSNYRAKKASGDVKV